MIKSPPAPQKKSKRGDRGKIKGKMEGKRKKKRKEGRIKARGGGIKIWISRLIYTPDVKISSSSSSNQYQLGQVLATTGSTNAEVGVYKVPSPLGEVYQVC